MERLENILGTIKEVVNENTKLEEEFTKKAEELREKCINNYNTIIKDTLENLNTIAKEMCERFEVYFNKADENNATEHFVIEYRGNSTENVYVAINADTRHYFRPFYSSGTVLHSDSIDRAIYRHEKGDSIVYDKADKERILGYSELLSTEDKANALLEEILTVYGNLFEKCAEKIKTENEEVSTKLKTLSEYLKDSSVVEEKEDGSIEIHLNGKTYKGVVVEE